MLRFRLEESQRKQIVAGGKRMPYLRRTGTIAAVGSNRQLRFESDDRQRARLRWARAIGRSFPFRFRISCFCCSHYLVFVRSVVDFVLLSCPRVRSRRVMRFFALNSIHTHTII